MMSGMRESRKTLTSRWACPTLTTKEQGAARSQGCSSEMSDSSYGGTLTPGSESFEVCPCQLSNMNSRRNRQVLAG